MQQIYTTLYSSDQPVRKLFSIPGDCHGKQEHTCQLNGRLEALFPFGGCVE